MPDLYNSGMQTSLARGNREAGVALIAFGLIIVGLIFLYSVGQYALIGRHPFEFFADSNTYHNIYDGYIVLQEGIVGVSFNFVGPMLILKLTGGNIYLVMIVNVLIFSLSMIAVSRVLQLDPVKTTLIQLLSPMTLSSLMSVNKEIIAFPTLVLLLSAYRYRSIPLFLAALGVSILARWQLSVFCLILGGVYFLRSANRYAILAVLLVSISTAYYAMQGILRPVLENVEASTAVYTEGSGLFERLNDLQNSGLYLLVAPIKAAHLLFSLGFKFNNMVNPIVVYNDQIVTTYCLMNFLFFVALIGTRRFRVGNDLLFISIIYLIVFALTPVYSPRYFYPVTVLWALALASAQVGILPTRARTRPVATQAFARPGR